jgi:hypothetical protein
VNPFAQVAARDFESAGANLAFEQFRLACLAQTSTERNWLRDTSDVFALIRCAAIERKLLRADDGFWIGERACLLRATGGSFDQSAGFGELRLQALGHFEGLIECQ